MKIQTNKDNELETFGAKSEESFGIGDTGFILNLLRSQLYSNIKRTIVQEYMCNARDAHREVGTPNKKIVVSLPTSFEPYWKVRDFGPGISPERMSTVFIKYGNSTKRGSNVETGGFGLGAKSAFGYKDSFIVNTFIDKIKRSYSAVIDATEEGVLQLLSETPTTEPNGTEIVVPIEQKDITQFVTETFSVLRHWKVYPEIKNIGHFGHLQSQMKPNHVLSGTRWFIEQSNRKMVYAILDEVEYAIPDTMIDYNKVRVGNSKLYLEFKTGELEVAPNREQLKQSESNKKKVFAVIDQFEADSKKEFDKELQTAETFVDAIYLFDSIKTKISIPFEREQFEWKGIQLISPYINLANNSGYCMNYRISTLEKLEKKPSTTFKIDSSTLYVLTNADFNKHAEKALEIMLEKASVNRTKYARIMLINVKNIIAKDQEELGLLKISSHKLEDYYKFMDAKERRKALTKTLFFKLQAGVSVNDNGVINITNSEFYRSSIAEFEEDKKKKAFVFLYDDKLPIIEQPTADPKLKVNYTLNSLGFLTNHTGYTIYGFKESQVSKEKVKEILEEDGAISVGALILEQAEKITPDDWNNIESYRNVRTNYYSDAKYENLLPNSFHAIERIVSLSENKEKLQELKATWLKQTPEFVFDYLEQLKAYYSEIKKYAQYEMLYNMAKETINRNDSKYRSNTHQVLVDKLKKSKELFEKRYVGRAYLGNYITHSTLLHTIHLIDTLENIGYKQPTEE